MVTCPICNKKMNYINNRHLHTHNIKQEFFLLNKKCIHCGQPISFEKRETNFCNHSCAAKHYVTGKKRKTPVYSEETMKSWQHHGRINMAKNPLYIIYKIEKINITKQCAICNCDFHVGSTNKKRKTCSPECLYTYRSKFNAAQGVNYGKNGYYKGIYCASSWELAFLIHSLDNGKFISRCQLTFEYKLKGKMHTYFPDFIMDGIIYEVKGRELEDVALKTKAVIKAGYKIQIIRRKEIEPIIKELKEQYSLKNLVDLYDMVEDKAKIENIID